ncbi:MULTISPECIES: hypothetical protein [unclassified Rickettsia]
MFRITERLVRGINLRDRHCEEVLPAWVPQTSLRATEGLVAWL